MQTPSELRVKSQVLEKSSSQPICSGHLLPVDIFRILSEGEHYTNRTLLNFYSRLVLLGTYDKLAVTHLL